MKTIPTLIMALSLSSSLFGQENKPMVLDLAPDMRDNASSGIAYLKGKQLALELLKEGYTVEDFSIAAMQKGFAEALSLKDSTVKHADFQVAVSLAKAKLQERELKLAKVNVETSKAWLVENAKKEGVKETASGLQYKAVKKLELKDSDKVDSEAENVRYFITYQSANKDGVVFEQSPAKKLVGVGENLLPGLAEALDLMAIGDHWQLYMKSELAYGGRRVGAALEPGGIVIMDVVLAAIKPQ